MSSDIEAPNENEINSNWTKARQWLAKQLNPLVWKCSRHSSLGHELGIVRFEWLFMCSTLIGSPTLRTQGRQGISQMQLFTTLATLATFPHCATVQILKEKYSRHIFAENATLAIPSTFHHLGFEPLVNDMRIS